MSFRKIWTLGLVVILTATAANAKKTPQHVVIVPLTPQQTALVQKSIAQEHLIVKAIQKSTPIVQTYIQNTRPDDKLTSIPVSDEYSIARVDFSKTFTALNYNEKSQSKGFFRGTSKYLADLTKSFRFEYSQTGFMDMMFLDPVGFDQQHYDFVYVRREFLGSIRTVVFDVQPKASVKGYGRFFGRIWIEDDGGNIVRFNGTFTGSTTDSGMSHYFHFDSWRTNLQPGVWLPTAIYVEETHESVDRKAVGFRAQTFLWGYSLKLPQHDSSNESIEVENAQDQSGQAQDVGPLEAQRQWVSQAENNVLDRLTQAGLLAPPSDFDKVLETVANNIIIGSKLVLPDDIHCRVLLTAPLESLSIANTILISKGLVDTLPSEEDLAAILSFQLAHIALGHHIDTRYAFNDRLLFPDEATFQRINMNHTTVDNEAAAKKAVELFNASVYAGKTASVGLFFQQLTLRQSALTALLTPRLGDPLLRADGTPWLSGLTKGAPKLNPDDLTQIAALPLNSHLRIDPWDDKVFQLNVKAAPLITARDKMPFEVTPVFFRLQAYQPPVEPAANPAAPAQGAATPAAAPADTTQAPPANPATPSGQSTATPAPADNNQAQPSQGTSNPPPVDTTQNPQQATQQ